ncbi:MAG: DUF4062 domain-containing protein [Anaerolineae bacterium]|nr:DUF4062 domain-containing protein [Anaerolineae bacterium]
MVSSTSKDLPEHRKAAIDSIWRRDMFPLAMEAGAATPADAIQFSLDMVEEAEVYIGIFGHRYGYIPDNPRNPDKVSITELEYRRALERGIPILIFFMHHDHPGPKAGEAETFYEFDADKKAKLKRLKDELGTRYVASFFKSPDELNAQIYHALTELKEKGQIAYEAEAEKPDADELTPLPKPPTPYTPHRYIQTQTFIGRKAEFELLDQWANSSDSTLIIDAIGGMGKSALAWEWFGRQVRFAGCFWWSFYESDSAMTNFTRHALAYLTEQPLKTFDNMPGEERERQLLTILAQKPYLLVLDGLERILVAYHRLDAPHLLDDEAETRRPETQKGTSAGLRDCVDIQHGDFLRKLAVIQGSKILISTRLIPADLQNKAGRLLPNIHHYHLDGLTDSDALSLMNHLGVHGDKSDMIRFLKQFDNHSLLLTVIAGRISDYFPAPGNFDVWLRDEGVRLNLAELEAGKRRTTILAYALNGLKPELHRFLSQIAAFRYPVDYTTLSALNPYLLSRPKRPRVSWLGTYTLYNLEEKLRQTQSVYDGSRIQQAIQIEENNLANTKSEWKAFVDSRNTYEHQLPLAIEHFHFGLKELEGRGLLQWDRAANTYDLHPVVRAYAFEQLQGNDRQATFEQIRDHFEGIPPKSLDKVRELGDLRRDLEIYSALVGANLLDKAASFYGERLADVLYYNLASYNTIVELLTPLFQQGFNHLPTLSHSSHKSNRIADLANALLCIGRSVETQNLEALRLKIDLADRNIANLCTSLESFSLTLRSQNHLAGAFRAAQIALDLAETSGIRDGIAMAHLRLMRVNAFIGHRTVAEAHYRTFMSLPPRRRTDFWKSAAEHGYAELLIQYGENSDEVLNRAEVLAIESQNTLIHRDIHRLRGEVALNLQQPDVALEYFNRAASMARYSGSSDLSVHLAGMAQAYAQQGNNTKAQKYLNVALVNLLGESLVEVFIAVAKVYMLLDKHEIASHYALQAYKSAWADGLPYVWWWHLERAKKVLDALGQPYPDLPPFDPSKVEPIPYEAEIRAFIEELKAKKGRFR